MQVKVKLGREWWLIPIKGEFTEEELAPLLHKNQVEVLQKGETVRFFNLQPKKTVLRSLVYIKNAVQQGYKMKYKHGAIEFYKVKEKK
jgi:hypothetical protein